MKVAEKSSEKASSRRYTLTVGALTYRNIEKLSGGRPRSNVVDELVEREMRSLERRELAQRLLAEYTPEVQNETLRINDQYPVNES